MEPDKFVAEGKMEIGPMARYFTFLDGEHVGRLLLTHFRLPEVSGYTDLGRVRITVERLEPPKA